MSRGKEKVMKRTVRIMLTCLVLLLGITSAVPAQAAAKKKVSVLTQMVVDHVQEDEDGGYTYKLTYDKKGFIKKVPDSFILNPHFSSKPVRSFLSKTLFC